MKGHHRILTCRALLRPLYTWSALTVVAALCASAAAPAEAQTYENWVIADDFNISCPACQCDFNFDGVCNLTDVAFVTSCINNGGGVNCDQADLNCDGALTNADLTAIQCLLAGNAPDVCCPNTRPKITRVRWYGSYLDPEFEPPGNVRDVDAWLIGLHSDVPAQACPPVPAGFAPFDFCGTLKVGVEGPQCMLFTPSGSGNQYLIANPAALNPFGAGDTLRICGYVDPQATTCLQGLGPVTVQQVSACSTGVSRPDRLLAQWGIDPALVTVQDTGKIGWDGHKIFCYTADLPQGCLLHNFSTAGEVDATKRICPLNNRTYWLSIQAAEGHALTINADGSCNEVPTGDPPVIQDFWGWHTTPPGYQRLDDAFMGSLHMAIDPNDPTGCAHSWVYDWMGPLHCSDPRFTSCCDDPTKSIDMAFYLIQTGSGTCALSGAACSSNADCNAADGPCNLSEFVRWYQPVNPGPPTPPLPPISPLPPGSVDELKETTATITITIQGLPPEQVTLVGPTVVKRGTAHPDPGAARKLIDTEIIAMQLVGSSPNLGAMQLGLDPNNPSTGQSARVDGDFQVDSFFDILPEITLGTGQQVITQVPVHIQAVHYEIPPGRVSFVGPVGGPVPLFDLASGVQVGTLDLVEHFIPYNGGVDVHSDIDWPASPINDCCKPDPAATGCLPVICPDPTQTCVPTEQNCNCLYACASNGAPCTTDADCVNPGDTCDVIGCTCTVAVCECRSPVPACQSLKVSGVYPPIVCVNNCLSADLACVRTGIDTDGDGIDDKWRCDCDPISDPTGVCCDANGNCFVSTATQCPVPPNVGFHAGATCTGQVACCLPDGTCANLEPICCVDLGGKPSFGAVCTGTTESCCFANGSCQDLDPVCCLDQGGTPGGVNSACANADINGNGIDDACESICPLAPQPSGDFCQALQTTDCIAGAADALCWPSRIIITPGVVPPFTVENCACMTPGGCGAIRIDAVANLLVCDPGCPPGQECLIHINGISSGQASLDPNSPQVNPGDVITCACADVPTGVCCDANGNCFASTAAQCPVPPNVGFHAGATCTGQVACCLPDGTCANLEPICCQDLGGTSIAGAVCTGTTESCCFADGSCADLDPVCCQAQGGTPGGVNSACANADTNNNGIDDACESICPLAPQPSGDFCQMLQTTDCTAGTPTALCWPSRLTITPGVFPPFTVENCACMTPGGCGAIRIDLAANLLICDPGCPPGQECLIHINGISSGQASLDPNSPQVNPGDVITCACADVPTGVCCDANGNCFVSTAAQCPVPPNVGFHAGATCTGQVACCLPDGTCANLEPICCQDLGGSTSTSGAVCGGTLESCCFADGSCADLDAVCCLDRGGTPGGAGSACANADTNNNGIDDACESICPLAPAPSGDFCQALQTTDCIAGLAAELCWPSRITITPGMVPPFTVENCACMTPGGCGAINISSASGLLICEPGCPPGEECLIHINGISSGQPSIDPNDPQLMAGDVITCACGGAVCEPTLDGQACHDVVCPIPGDICVPQQVKCTAAGCRVTVCDCQPPNVCHVNPPPAGTTDPVCSGGCPFANQLCLHFVKDLDGDGVPQEHFCKCVKKLPPIVVNTAVLHDRYLSLSFAVSLAAHAPVDPTDKSRDAASAGKPLHRQLGATSAAIRVKVDNAPQFPAATGNIAWVGTPSDICEDALSTASPPACTQGSFTTAALQCDPLFMDWTTVASVNVRGPDIVPGPSTYIVQEVDASCADLTNEACYSDPVVISTRKWGDIVTPFGGGSQPNFADISKVVDKFQDKPGALSKAETDLGGHIVDLKVNFADINLDVQAFQGAAYPFSGPCTCPSSSTCPTNDACGRCAP